MMRMLTALALCVAAVALSVGVSTAVAGGGNSANAKACQKNGWQSLVGSDGETFASDGACVSYGAHGGTYATSGLIIPRGTTATFTNPVVGTEGFQDTNSWGYQLNFGANVTVGGPLAGGNPGDAFGPSSTTIGPFPTAVLLRVFLHDSGLDDFVTCNYTAYNDQAAALVIGSNPYSIGINDSEVCSQTPDNPFSKPSVDDPIDSNFLVTLTIS